MREDYEHERECLELIGVSRDGSSILEYKEGLDLIWMSDHLNDGCKEVLKHCREFGPINVDTLAPPDLASLVEAGLFVEGVGVSNGGYVMCTAKGAKMFLLLQAASKGARELKISPLTNEEIEEVIIGKMRD